MSHTLSVSATNNRQSTKSSNWHSYENLPKSIQKEMSSYKNRDVRKANIGLVSGAAEAFHRPEDGYVSGLDAKEIEVLSKLDSKLGEEYEKMANSSINQLNIQRDITNSYAKVNQAQELYQESYENLKGNWFTNLFRSKGKKEELQQKYEQAKKDLDYAKLERDYTCKNVISYETILQRNGGATFD